MILLKNCLKIATFNRNLDELSGYDILIEGNIIKRISKNIEVKDAKVIDCSDYLVIPGLVNTHHHFYQTLTRNLRPVQDAKLFDWLTFLYPIWAKIDTEAVYLSTKLAILELLKTGCTLTTDHHYLYPSGFNGDLMGIQFEAAEETGIRFAPTRGAMTRGRSNGGLPPDEVVQKVDEVIKDMERVIDKYHNPEPFSMKRVILAPCSPFSVEEEGMRETAKLARDKGVRLHTHLAETQDEDRYCMEKYGKRPLALMEELDWVGEDVFFAHGIWFNDEELRLLKDTGTGIAHCPTSNMRLGSGIARIREMIDMGIKVGLGVDGSASNDSSDMLGEVRNAMLLQRIKYGEKGLTAREALLLGTRNGAELLGFPETGSIEEGKAADLAIFDISHIQYAGAHSDPVAAIVFSGYCHLTVLTIVNGKILIENGKHTSID
ncbi:MAG TPA: 8-oxoguanine deaminase, partial [candidate division WOR-3 bacterium]|nr:8-oxoguanine deaminase [candidate division WOR-3 bacterium]